MSVTLKILFSVLFTSYSGNMELGSFDTPAECESFYELMAPELASKGIRIKNHVCVVTPD